MTTEITRIIKGFKEFSENPYLDTINFLRDYLEVEQTSEAFFELGKALFFNEDWDESIECLEKTDDIRKDAYIGLVHYKKEDYKEAITHFEKFLREKENGTIRNYLLISYENVSDWKSAISCCETLLEKCPKNKSIKMHLIDCLFSDGQFERCLLHINGMNCKKLDIKKGLCLIGLGRYSEGITALEKVRTIESWEILSDIYEKLEKPSRAIRYLQKIYESSGDIEILFRISDMHCRFESYEGSVNILGEILEIEADNERALERIAGAYASLLKTHEAIEYGERLLKVNEKNVSAYASLSKAYYNINDLENAEENVRKGLAINPESADLWVQKAWIDYYTDFEEFVKDYDHALKLEPNNTKNYVKLIWFCAFEEKEDYARKYYERLLFYNPTFRESFEEVTKYADY